MAVRPVADPAAGPAAYEHDLGGRLVALSRPGQALELAYDSDDHIARATDPVTGEAATYAFDAMGRRVASADAAGARRHLTAPVLGDGLESPQMVTDEAGTPLATWVYGGELPVLRIGADGEPVYYLMDPMGTVLALADGAGARVARFEHDAFGREREAAGPAADLPATLGGDVRYHGQWQDAATGLYHVRARTYDPETGRFTSRDPVEGVFEQPESFHAYTWNANNPHVFRDPTGMFSMASISVANGVQGNLTTITRTAFVRMFRERIKDEVLGVAGDLFLGFLKNLIPGTVPVDALLSAGESFRAGRFFEGLFVRQICSALPDFADQLFGFPQIHSSGEPRSNGANCGQIGAGILPNGGNIPRPDLVISPAPLEGGPDDVASGRKKAHLIIEIKTSTGAFVNKFRSRGSDPNSQLAAILRFASKHEYGHLALMIALKGGADREAVARRMVLEGLSNNVVVVFITLIN